MDEMLNDVIAKVGARLATDAMDRTIGVGVLAESFEAFAKGLAALGVCAGPPPEEHDA